MSKVNFLKPDNQNLSTYLYSGSFLFFIAIIDVFLSSFFNVNFTSMIYTIRAFMPAMLDKNSGHIINISSALHHKFALKHYIMFTQTIF